MIRTLFDFTGYDGWWPRWNAEGTALVFGNVHGRVWRVGEREVDVIAPGRNFRWLHNHVVIWQVEVAPGRDEIWTKEIGSDPVRLDVDPGLGGGNWFEADLGNWASVRPNHLTMNGRFITDDAYGLSLAGDWTVTANAHSEQWILYLRGIEWARIPLPPRANSWRIFPNGDIGYGYWWEAKVRRKDGTIENVTVTPWGQESIPVLVPTPHGEWCWTATERGHRPLVIGRPTGAKEVIILEEFPCVSLDVRYVNGEFLVAGCSDRGALTVRAVTFDHPRQLLPGQPVPDPEPEPEPEPEPGPSMHWKTFDWNKVSLLKTECNPSGWPLASKILEAECRSGFQKFEHTRSGEWKTCTPLDTTTVFEGNVWIVFSRNGQWFACPYDWLKVGQTSKGETSYGLSENCGLKDEWRGPEEGDHCGLFVSTPCRGAKDSYTQQRERSPIVWFAFGGAQLGTEGGPIVDPDPDPDPPPDPSPDLVERLIRIEAGLGVLAQNQKALEARLAAIEQTLTSDEGTTRVLDEVGKVLVAAKAQRALELSFKYLGTGKGKIVEVE